MTGNEEKQENHFQILFAQTRARNVPKGQKPSDPYRLTAEHKPKSGANT